MNLFEDQSRRRFVKTFVFGAVTAGLCGRAWRGTFLAEASPVPAGVNVGILQIKISDYPLLQEEFGSIRLAFNPINSDSSGPLGFFYPVLINRGEGDNFYAMDSGCSHAGYVVPIYDPFEGAMICPGHGSHYSIDGTVWEDQEASNSLTRFDLTYDGADTLTIKVPFLGYSVTCSAVTGASTPRLQLGFPTFFGVEYEVRFRARIENPWTVAPFATSLDGPADQMSLIGDEQPATVFVERTTVAGFFSVAVKVLDLTLPE
jgi:Rieske Fe-S protein